MANRIVKDSIRTSKSVNELSDFQFRLWIYLITYVDDYGRGSADPELLKGFVFPRRKGVTEQQILRTLDDLANAGMIHLYEIGGEPFLYFPNWDKHQRIQTKRSKFPAPAEEHGEQPLVPENPPWSTVSHGESPWDTVTHGDSPPESESESESESILASSDEDARQNEFRRVIDAWNSLGLSKVTKLVPNTDRHRLLTARLKQYGEAEVLRAIENVRTSKFLNGGGQKGFVCTFDWFIRPNNFPKVLDGNYNSDDKPKVDPRAYDGAKWLAGIIAERVSGFQQPTPKELDRWALDLDMLHRQGYTWKQISDTAAWAVNDVFWAPVIVSGDALRKNFVKLMAKEAAESG